jgi:hypothetical protein
MRFSTGTYIACVVMSLSYASTGKADLLNKLGGATLNAAIDKLNSDAAQRISQLLDGFQTTSQSLLDQGAHDSNLLLVQGGNEMQLAIASARAQFGNEMTNQVSQATDGLKPFLVELERFQLSVDELKNNAVDIEDLFALDLQDLPFSQSYFGIRRVLGTVIVQNKADSYKIVLRGPHFGVAGAGETITYDVKLDGVSLGAPELGASPDDAVFRVPSTLVNDKFQQRILVTIPLQVNISHDTPRRYLVVPGKHESITHSFAVSLMPDYAGDMKIVTTRPIFKWKDALPPETQDHTVTGPFTFSYAVANPSLLATPNPGEQKVSNDIKMICHEDMRPARAFPNGVRRFSTDPIFSNGWYTAKYIGADPVDWDFADQEVYNTWGIHFGTWHDGNCGPVNSGRHCLVPAAVMISGSVPTSLDATGCHDTSVGAPQWRNNHTQVSVDVNGGVATHPAPWSVTFQASSYLQDGAQDDEAQTLALYASRNTEIDVTTHANTSSKVTFTPFVGKQKEGQLGHDIGTDGPKLESSSRIGGDIERYEYSFRYPSSAP